MSGRPGRSATEGRLVAARQLEEQAVRLRALGGSYASIGASLGVSSATAWKSVSRALRRVPVEDVERMRQIESRAIQEVRRQAWEVIAHSEDDNVRLHAMVVVLRSSESLRRLYALDPPSRVEVQAEVAVETRTAEERAASVLARVVRLRTVPDAGPPEPHAIPPPDPSRYGVDPATGEPFRR